MTGERVIQLVVLIVFILCMVALLSGDAELRGISNNATGSMSAPGTSDSLTPLSAFVLALAIFALFVVMITEWVLQSKIIKILRSELTPTWKALGEPTLARHGSKSSYWKFLKFLWSSAATQLAHPRLRRLVRVERGVAVLGVAALLTAVSVNVMLLLS